MPLLVYDLRSAIQRRILIATILGLFLIHGVAGAQDIRTNLTVYDNV